MSNFDWNRYLKQHPIFSDLRNEEIAPLLDESVSIEKNVAQDQIIVKERDQDQSIYLIGQGSANVFLKGPNEQDVFLNSMGKGDLIGEMALFEQKPRSATVIATEPCTLLEFNGREFIKLLQVHPEIGFKLLVKLSERLRDLGDHVLNEKLRGVDEKIKHVNAKLDTEIKIIDASLKATQTVFDQTSKRAHEVIDSADRSRSRFTVAASTLGTIFTILLSALSYMGYTKVQNVSEITVDVENKYKEINKQVDELKIRSQDAKTHSESIAKASDDIKKIRLALDNSKYKMKDFYMKTLVPQFFSEMGSDIGKAEETYKFILSFKDDDVSDALYRQIILKILPNDAPMRKSYAEILRTGIDDHINALSDRQKTLSFYLLLATFILNGDNSQYNKTLAEFKAELKDIQDPVKETAKAEFGAAVFEEFIQADAESIDDVQEAKIDKINTIWGLIP